ncbi:MAG: DUF1846 domain-containing protein [Clostridia bacterium]|nr:DUF1846 domain-containing protein [Clostridia bacterium]
MQIGFDNQLYREMQSKKIRERIDMFGGKLYLEFGGKLFDDYHASRVLPGFLPNSKISMLLQMKDQTEIIIVINADDIEKNKVRGDLGITYDMDLLRLADAFTESGLTVSGVVITHWREQPAAYSYECKLKTLGLRVYRHYPIHGYPSDLQTVLSADGFGKNDYIETTKPLVVITAPGPGSGKMATCLSQLYQDHERGIDAGYAKFETFPIWNIPLNHPVNLAYEAATADLSDLNMIDPFHLEAYRQTVVNYNRDVEVFPVLKAMFERIYGKSTYLSPTDMGVNMAGKCITDDAVVRHASEQEIIRRYYEAACELRKGSGSEETVQKLDLLIKKAGISLSCRASVGAALKRAEETGKPATAMEMPDGQIISSKTSSLLHATSAVILDALKYLAGLPDELRLLPTNLLIPVNKLKTEYLGRNPLLHVYETLMILSIEAENNEAAQKAYSCIPQLRDLEMHSTVIVSSHDAQTLKNLGIRLTCEPQYPDNRLYHK